MASHDVMRVSGSLSSIEEVREGEKDYAKRLDQHDVSTCHMTYCTEWLRLSYSYAMVTNKTDIVRFQRFAYHRRIWWSPGHRTIFMNFHLRGLISYGRRPASVYENIVRCPAGVVRDQPDTVRLIKHRLVPGQASSGARTDIGRIVKRFFKVTGACQTSHDARPGTVKIVRYKSQTKIARCPSDVRKRHPGTVWCPADVILSSMTQPNGAVEF